MEKAYKFIRWIPLVSAIITIFNATKPYWEGFKMNWGVVIPFIIFVISSVVWMILGYKKSRREETERITKIVFNGVENAINPLAALLETSQKNLESAIQGIDKLRKELERAGHIKPDPMEESNQKILIDSLKNPST